MLSGVLFASWAHLYVLEEGFPQLFGVFVEVVLVLRTYSSMRALKTISASFRALVSVSPHP